MGFRTLGRLIAYTPSQISINSFGKYMHVEIHRRLIGHIPCQMSIQNRRKYTGSLDTQGHYERSMGFIVNGFLAKHLFESVKK